MSQFLGFGSGKDGAVPSTGTYNGENQSCSGSSGSTTLTCGGTFTAGDIILIIQSRGTGVDDWELNQVKSDNGATLTLLLPLVNTYTDSGDSQAQVIEMKEYNGGTVSGTLTSNGWAGNTGGIMPILCSGKLIVSGSLHVNAKGFRGAGGGSPQAITGRRGEGSVGAGWTRGVSANGSGAGGGEGQAGGGEIPAGAGGGGGHAGSGTAGTGFNGGTGGAGGTSTGSADLTAMTFGGAGGEGGTRNNTTTNGAVEGYGGGIIAIFAKELEVTGSITANGQNAVSGESPYGEGGGAGGAVLVKAVVATLGSSKITAAAGSGAGGGGAGSVGRIRIEACSITGSTSPAASEDEGGQDWCSKLGHIF